MKLHPMEIVVILLIISALLLIFREPLIDCVVNNIRHMPDVSR